MKKYPKVLVTAPTHESKNYCVYKWMENVANFTYGNFEVYLSDNSPTPDNAKWLNRAFGIKVGWKDYGDDVLFKKLTKSHEDCRKYAMDGNFDYMFHLETDVFPPSNVIERLIFHRKKVVNGWYLIGGGGRRHPVYRLHQHKTKLQKHFNWVFHLNSNIHYLGQKDLIKVVQSGLGCQLIHKSIFQRQEFRHPLIDGETKVYEANSKDASTDSYWCNDLFYKTKVDNFVDLSLFCGHENDNYSWGRNADLIIDSKNE